MAKDDWEEVGIAPAWEPKENEELVGVFTEKEENVGPNGSNMYYIQQKNGQTIGVWGNTVLDTRFKNLTPGEEVKVVFLGEAVSEKTKRTYKNFQVWHRKPSFEEVEEPEVNPDDVDL